MAKHKAEGEPVPYPKNWGRMSRAERDQWEQENRGRAPRPAVEPIKPARGAERPTAPAERPTAAPSRAPTEADEADEYNDDVPRPAAGKLVHNSQDADEVRAMGEAAGELADRFDRMSGREIVLAILCSVLAGCNTPDERAGV